MTDFLEGNNEPLCLTLPFLEEHDLSTEAFEKMIEYMQAYKLMVKLLISTFLYSSLLIHLMKHRYTDGLQDIDPDQVMHLLLDR